jgi:anti-sigma regulatory factor (Ser/Thr protein kinase)
MVAPFTALPPMSMHSVSCGGTPEPAPGRERGERAGVVPDPPEGRVLLRTGTLVAVRGAGGVPAADAFAGAAAGMGPSAPALVMPATLAPARRCVRAPPGCERDDLRGQPALGTLPPAGPSPHELNLDLMHSDRAASGSDAGPGGGPARGRTAHRALPLGVHAVAEARRFVERTLADWAGSADLVDTVNLVVSELVTNAVLYGYGAATLQLRRETEVLVVEVSDRSAAVPAARIAHEESEIGRGLHIIEAVSLAWGVRPEATGGGKVVWCRLAWQGSD